MGALLVAMLVAQADGGSDFASAMRDEARRSDAACAALQRAGTNDCVFSDEPCAVKRVMEFLDEDQRPTFLVFFKDPLEDEPSNEQLGHIELFTENGRRIPLFWEANVLDESGTLTQLAGGPLFLAQQLSLEIPCDDKTAAPLIQQVLVVHALPRAPLVIGVGPPTRETKVVSTRIDGDGGMECQGCVCVNQSHRLTEVAPRFDWSWQFECKRTCTVRIGPSSALERGRPSAVFTWNKSAKRFDGPTDGAGFVRLDGAQAVVQAQLERLSRQYCQPAAPQDLRKR